MGLGERMNDIDVRVLTPNEVEALDRQRAADELRREAAALQLAIDQGEEEDRLERLRGEKGREPDAKRPRGRE